MLLAVGSLVCRVLLIMWTKFYWRKKSYVYGQRAWVSLLTMDHRWTFLVGILLLSSEYHEDFHHIIFFYHARRPTTVAKYCWVQFLQGGAHCIDRPVSRSKERPKLKKRVDTSSESVQSAILMNVEECGCWCYGSVNEPCTTIDSCLGRVRTLLVMRYFSARDIQRRRY